MEQDLITGVRFMGASSMIIIAFLLAVVNRGRVQSHVYNRSRLFMCFGCLFIGIHAVLHFFGHYREESPSLAWAISLFFFIPAIPLYNMAVLNLLRAGREMKQRYVRNILYGVVCYTIYTIGFFTDTLINDEQPWKTCTFIIACLIFCKVVELSIVLHRDEKAVKTYLADEELSERSLALHYTAKCQRLVLACALFIPFVGISSSLLLHAVLGLVAFGSMIWYVVQFWIYGLSMELVLAVNDEIFMAGSLTDEMGKNGTADTTLSVVTDDTSKVQERIDRWVAQRHFTNPNITIANALNQMDITAEALNSYLSHHTPASNYRHWIPYLRIEEAKRLMRENPNYSYDTLAEQCGFSTGGSMARAFKASEGMTPMQWMEKN